MRNEHTYRKCFNKRKGRIFFLCFFLSTTSKIFAQVGGDLIANKGINATEMGVKDTLFTNLNLSDLKRNVETHIYAQRLDSITKRVSLDYNPIVGSFIDMYVGSKGRKQLIGKMLALSKYYFPIFEKSLQEQDIPTEIKYLSIVESALNPNAISRVGATGPWQFMYATAKVYDLEINSFIDERKDPILSSRAAALYFRDAYDEFGDWLLAIAAYNCGKGNVQRAIDRAKSTNFWEIRPYLPKETRDYVPAYIAVVYAMNYYQQHGIEVSKTELNSNTDIMYLDKAISLVDLSKALGVPLVKLKTLNPLFKKHIAYGTLQKPCRVVIPVPTREQYASLYEVLDNPINVARASAELGKFIDFKKKRRNSNRDYFVYRVKRGDALSEIAEQFDGATVSEIKSLNGLKKSKLQAGMMLKIPKG